MKLYFEELHNEIKQHALEVYPEECCGIIVEYNTIQKNKLLYCKCENVADDKLNHFEISAVDFIRAEMIGNIKAIIHSHDNSPHASKHDMEEQLRHGVPFGIVNIKNGQVQDLNFWGDRLPIQDYIKRPFRHGIYDCFSLVRDYHRGELGVTLKEVPREYKWWETDENLLYESLGKVGFVVLKKDLKYLEQGDCVLAQVRADYINHCGVYIGNGLLLHHLCLTTSHLSKTEPINSINRKHLSYIVRHKEIT